MRRLLIGVTGLALTGLLTASVWAATIVGTPKNDTLLGTAKADVLDGKAGNDRLYGRGGDDVLKGGVGNDLLVGGPGNDRYSCGAGKDAVLGGPGDKAAISATVKYSCQPPDLSGLSGRAPFPGGPIASDGSFSNTSSAAGTVGGSPAQFALSFQGSFSSGAASGTLKVDMTFDYSGTHLTCTSGSVLWTAQPG